MPSSHNDSVNFLSEARRGRPPGDNYESRGQLVSCKINIFNISKISEVRGGRSPRIKRLSE